ncbi:MAG: sugar O-acetyltransferase precursor [Flavipsychrobacter sp.]|jgi:hypothetical protein|nr:sugar O-acetyltransferase precursor [Flavipsychrobacter sp.]
MELKTTKGRLFSFLLMIILLPLLQNAFNVIESGPLAGTMVSHPNVQFTPATWWDGSYQEKKTLHVNDSVGFRPDLVRITNQINYWVFKTLPNDIYVGKNGYLFMKDYVNEYEGRSFSNDVGIRATLIKLKLIQDTLERMGKTCVFIYAPGKVYSMPENMPWSVQRSGGPKIRNYDVFKRIGDSLKIRQLDMNALFMAMKDTSKELLFTRQGIHWSLYGSLLASDTVIKYIERERNIKMPHLVITKLCHPDEIKHPDNDLAQLSNVIFPIAKEKVCYPEFHYDTDSTKTKPKIIFIGDSFGGQWIANELPQNVSTDWEFWFYFNWVWDQQHPTKSEFTISTGYDWQKRMLGADCLILIYNPVNLIGITNEDGVIGEIYKYFFPGKK